MAEIKPRPLGEVREANAKSFVRVRIHQEEGKKTLRRSHEARLWKNIRLSILIVGEKAECYG